jgi:hypothetical protein
MTEQEIARIMNKVTGGAKAADLTALSNMVPAFEQMAAEGSTVVFKIDGERLTAGIPNIYTVVVTGGKLKENFFRKDSANLIEAASEAIQFYNTEVWKE